MTTPETWLILLIVLGLWLTLTRYPLAYHPALPATRLPPDCRPFCRHASANDCSGTAPASPPRPWRERKSRRGAPKRVLTDGYARANPARLYVGIRRSLWLRAMVWLLK